MKISENLKKYAIVPNEYLKVNNVYIINTKNGKYVYKDKSINNDIYNYLKSRNFDYIPKLISDTHESFLIRKYEEDYDIPSSQKITDLINIISLLHNKTTHYKEIDSSYYDELYNDLSSNIDYLYGYYTDIITVIETKVFMSPSEYTLAKNIDIVYNSLDECRDILEKWKIETKDKQKIRNVILHNNLKLDHFICNKNPFLISWSKAKVDSPVFDLYKLYKNHGLEYNFEELFKLYESNYPLKQDEKYLLYVLILLPDIIYFKDDIYTQTKKISHMISSLFKTKAIIEKA